jgi:hypothetical protein
VLPGEVQEQERVSGSLVYVYTSKWPGAFTNRAKYVAYYEPFIRREFMRGWGGTAKDKRYGWAKNRMMVLYIPWNETHANASAIEPIYVGISCMDKGWGSKSARMNPVYHFRAIGQTARKGHKFIHQQWPNTHSRWNF